MWGLALGFTALESRRCVLSLLWGMRGGALSSRAIRYFDGQRRMEEEMRQDSRQRTDGWRRVILGTLACLLISLVASGGPGPKFYDDDPITVEPETQDASRVQPGKIDLFYDLLLNQFARPGDHDSPRARNVNSIDEVPDSS